MSIYLGIDFGTSGARAIAIDRQGEIQAQTSLRFDHTQQNLAALWQATLWNLLESIPETVRHRVQAIAINGTSSTVLVCDPQGRPLREPLLYNDDRGLAVLDQVRAIAPAHHTVISATSSLAKLIWMATEQGTDEVPVTPFPHPSALDRLSTTLFPHPSTASVSKSTSKSTSKSAATFLHQADWLSFLLHGRLGISDYHNALKLGYDVGALCYPDWMANLPGGFQLPLVVTPGEAIAAITTAVANQFGFPPNCLVCAGTTDSIAAFLASGAHSPGEAVTSLGSTLVLKLLSEMRVDDARYGIYSHRLGDLWLVGGASNTGGAVLKQFFNDTELAQLSQHIDPAQESQLDYYPLTKPGERFPINDPNLLPQLQPRPTQDVEFLHGLLESMARIETRGYHLLQDLGATSLTRVYTAGGGAKNQVWSAMRSRYLGVSVLPSIQTEAAYGTALLARWGSGSQDRG